MSTEVVGLEQRALSVSDQVKAFKITDNDTYAQAGELLKGIKALEKEVHDEFDSICEKTHQAHKEATSKRGRHLLPLAQAEEILKRLLSAYDQERERLRIAEENRLNALVRKQQEEAQLAEAVHLESIGETKEAEAVLSAPAPVQTVVVPKSTPKVSGISSKPVWKFRVKNPALVKREYLILDEKTIGALVKNKGKLAESMVGGIEVYEETIVSVRSK